MTGFVNAFPNAARGKKGNLMTLDMLCESAYQGDVEIVEKMLKSGDEDNIFNGDVNTHFTDVTALHMAAMAGQEECVKLLLGAGADPHVRCRVPDGKDPKTGQLARDKATTWGHESIVKILKKAEEDFPPGWYAADGIGNNRKLYSEPESEPKSAQQPQQPKATPNRAVGNGFEIVGPGADGSQTKPVGLMFPGQGSQFVKMFDQTKALPKVKEMLDKAQEILGYDLLQLCLEGPEEKLEETRYCQPALFVGGLAGAIKLLGQDESAVKHAQCVAGLSLGEYTALVMAGVFSFEDGLRLVKLRGEAMQEAAAASKQCMVSIAGLEQKVLEGLCKDAAKKEGSGAICMVANNLFPKGFACAGTEKAIIALQEAALAKGALQAKMLKTSGAFHTELMKPAQEKLKKALNDLRPKMQPPRCTIYMNVTGEPLAAGADPAIIADLLAEQLVKPVQWCPSVERMIQDGVSEFYECGPQKQLKAMMKRINQKAWNKTTNVEI